MAILFEQGHKAFQLDGASRRDAQNYRFRVRRNKNLRPQCYKHLIMVNFFFSGLQSDLMITTVTQTIRLKISPKLVGSLELPHFWSENMLSFTFKNLYIPVNMAASFFSLRHPSVLITIWWRLHHPAICGQLRLPLFTRLPEFFRLPGSIYMKFIGYDLYVSFKTCQSSY